MILPVWPDLQFVRRVARVHRGARGADRGAELIRQALDQREILGAAEGATAGHDARCRLQVRPVGRARPTPTRIACASAAATSSFDRLDGARCRPRQRAGTKRRAPSRRSAGLRRLRRSRSRCRHRPGGGIASRRLDCHDVAELRRTEQRGDARHQVLAEGRRGPEAHACSPPASFATCGASTAASGGLVRGMIHQQHARDARDRGRRIARPRRHRPRARRS